MVEYSCGWCKEKFPDLFKSAKHFYAEHFNLGETQPTSCRKCPKGTIVNNLHGHIGKFHKDSCAFCLKKIEEEGSESHKTCGKIFMIVNNQVFEREFVNRLWTDPKFKRRYWEAFKSRHKGPCTCWVCR